jgi:CheY-like chemotaxis protein
MASIVPDHDPIRILFVEDEFLISTWVAESLSQQGFAVETVSNAADALRHLAAAPVDVLFTDINLPGGMDGATLARRARALNPHLAVVYASAQASMPGPDLRVPGSIFIAKPYAPAMVGRLLADAAKSGIEREPA